jgi:hypothetical protein
LERDKHSSLLRKLENYEIKSFITLDQGDVIEEDERENDSRGHGGLAELGIAPPLVDLPCDEVSPTSCLSISGSDGIARPQF